jgi:hypothetical protein
MTERRFAAQLWQFEANIVQDEHYPKQGGHVPSVLSSVPVGQLHPEAKILELFAH